MVVPLGSLAAMAVYMAMCTSAAAGGTAPAPAPAEELPCGSASGASASASKPLLGGYSSLNLTTAPLVTQQLVPLAWQSYAGSNAVGGCAAGTARLSSAYVKRACQQVVAGTNYAFAFDAAYSCAPDSASKTTALNAIVYEPLPGYRNGFQVTRVWPA